MGISANTINTGIPFHAEINSADVTGPSAFTIYRAGSVTELSVGANDTLVIDHVSVSINTTAQWFLFDGANTSQANGELIATGSASTAFSYERNFGDVPHWCQKGTSPTFDCSSATGGQAYIVLRGVLLRG